MRCNWLPPDERAARDAEIVRLSSAGLSAEQVAQRVGVTSRTVHRARSRAGLCVPPPPRLTDAEFARAEQLLDEGASYAEAARTLGRNPDNLRKRLPGRSMWAPGSGFEIRRFREALEAIPTTLRGVS